MLRDIYIISINRKIYYFLSFIIHTRLHFSKSCAFGITPHKESANKEKREAEASVMHNAANDGSSEGA